MACASHLLLTNNERERELTPTSFVHSSCQERFLSFSQLLCKRRFLLKKKRRIVRNPIFGWSRTEEKPVWCRVPPLGDRNVGTRRGAEEVGTFAMEAGTLGARPAIACRPGDDRRLPSESVSFLSSTPPSYGFLPDNRRLQRRRWAPYTRRLFLDPSFQSSLS